MLFASFSSFYSFLSEKALVFEQRTKMRSLTGLVSFLIVATVGVNAYVVVTCDINGNNCSPNDSVNVNVKQSSGVPVEVVLEKGNDPENQGNNEGSGVNGKPETASVSETSVASESSSKSEGGFTLLYVKNSPLRGRASTTVSLRPILTI